MIDNSFILNEIKKYKKFKSDAELAAFLGVSRQNVSSWYKRNKFNVKRIIDKIPELSETWLLTGEGSMLKDTTISNSVLVSGHNVKDNQVNYVSSMDQEALKKEIEHLQMLLIEKDKQLEEKDKLLAEKERLIEILLKNKISQ